MQMVSSGNLNKIDLPNDEVIENCKTLTESYSKRAGRYSDLQWSHTTGDLLDIHI